MQLNSFKITVRGVVERGLYDTNHKDVFGPFKTIFDKFHNLGIKGRQVAFNGCVHYESALQSIVEDRLITLGHRISGCKLHNFKIGQIGLKPTALALAGRAGWDSALSRHSVAQSAAVSKIMPICAESHNTNSITNVDDQPRVICLSCPVCKACELSSHSAFQLEDLDKECICRKCGKPYKAMHWT